MACHLRLCSFHLNLLNVIWLQARSSGFSLAGDRGAVSVGSREQGRPSYRIPHRRSQCRQTPRPVARWANTRAQTSPGRRVASVARSLGRGAGAAVGGARVSAPPARLVPPLCSLGPRGPWSLRPALALCAQPWCSLGARPGRWHFGNTARQRRLGTREAPLGCTAPPSPQLGRWAWAPPRGLSHGQEQTVDLLSHLETTEETPELMLFYLVSPCCLQLGSLRPQRTIRGLSSSV